LLLSECRAGLRWYSGSDMGDEFARTLAWGGEGDATAPGIGERTLAEYVDPSRTSSMVAVVNLVSEEMGMDVAGWDVSRLLAMAMVVEREREERDHPKINS